ncbi:MAG: nicotinate-nucleotide adenylyltransferase [Bryobacteraceae bacterium]
MRLAIFGGTFDPVHDAHLRLAREAAREFGLARVLFIPAGRPPHKRGATSAGYQDRYRMVELACQGEPLLEPSRIEAGSRMSYSIHTIEKVKAGLDPGDQVYFLIGADAFAEVQTWYRWKSVLDEVDFIVAARPGHDYLIPPGARVHRMEALALPVSSSDIRRRLAAGESPAEVPRAVLEYIWGKGLYGTRVRRVRGRARGSARRKY